MKSLVGLALLLAVAVGCAGRSDIWTRRQVIERKMTPYRGSSNAGVDQSTMTGKVLCGYQGWFTTPCDGLGRGWFHWGPGGGEKFEPGDCKIDLWPDVSELSSQERCDTAFRTASGQVAQVFSSFNRPTVLRHFKWMREYGIDGVFVQRFVAEVMRDKGFRQSTTVLNYCREGANTYGRAYAVMYDLSGIKKGETKELIADWKNLVDRMRIRDDVAYLHHNGKPVVAVWGMGFNDGREYTLDECIKLVEFLKDDPRYGNNTVMIGIPTYWRMRKFDAVDDPKLIQLIEKADVISPWTVGRYRNPAQAEGYAKNVMAGDIKWCREHRKEFLPVVYPGFSWHNMNPKAPSNPIPRLKGEFLWKQYVEAKKAGATMIYQAMFDEVDEGTAIFKCTNDVPVGKSQFLTYEGLPSDFYLKMVGRGAGLLRGEIASGAGRE